MKKILLVLAMVAAVALPAEARRKCCATSANVNVTTQYSRCDGTAVTVNTTGLCEVRHASIRITDCKHKTYGKWKYKHQCPPFNKTVKPNLRCGKYCVIVKINGKEYKKEIVVD